MLWGVCVGGEDWIWPPEAGSLETWHIKQIQTVFWNALWEQAPTLILWTLFLSRKYKSLSMYSMNHLSLFLHVTHCHCLRTFDGVWQQAVLVWMSARCGWEDEHEEQMSPLITHQPLLDDSHLRSHQPWPHNCAFSRLSAKIWDYTRYSDSPSARQVAHCKKINNNKIQ